MTSHYLAYTRREGFTIDYGRELEEEIVRLQKEIESSSVSQNQYPTRWLAIKLLEQDEEIINRIQPIEGSTSLMNAVNRSIAHLKEIYSEDVDTIFADRRYGWINGLVKETVKRTKPDKQTVSDQVDKVMTNRYLGTPIFLALMWVMFKFTTDISGPYIDWMDGIISRPITKWVASGLKAISLGGSWVESLFIDGIIAGVGGILVFVPVLMSLFLALAILEDSGYMARAAFVMDHLMHVVGLHGKSFLPMIVGFGCTVPAIYATRILENEKDRIITGMITPFMSCGARLPVYMLFAAIFFPEKAGTVVIWLYILGIATAILVGNILKNTLFKEKEESPFVIELPPYRVPTIKGIWFHIWEHTSAFLSKAWTVILLTSIIIWVLSAIPTGGSGSFANTNINESAFASMSKVIAPIFSPLGFGTWESAGSLVTGFIAKEVVVSTMSQVYDVEEAEEEIIEPTTFLEDIGEIITSFISATSDTLKSIPLIIGIDLFGEEEEEEMTDLMLAVEESYEASSNGHGALAGLAFLIFVLLYTPCMVAVAAEWQEFGAKWTWVSIIGQLILAWLIAFIVFQGGILLGLG